MSKKLIYIRIIIIVMCLCFIGIFVILFKSVQKSVSVEENIIEETEKEKVVFDLSKPPSEQRKKVHDNIKEYLRQLYRSIFNDDKLVNCTPLLSYRGLVDDFKSTKSLIEFIKPLPYRNLPIILFEFDNKELINDYFLSYPLNMDDLPVTENYKEKHKEPLFKEFSFIKKKDYKNDKKFYNEYMKFDYWYEFIYDYGVGVNEENKAVIVTENKSAALVYKERETGKEGVGIVRDKNGVEAPVYVNTRKFYFTYTLDEKGYVDDIKYDRTEIINDDKYLDNLIKYE